MRKAALAAILLATATPLGLAPAVGVAATAATPGDSLPKTDRAFLDEAIRDGVAEVELGKLAQEKAGSDAVKQFGQRMVDDHQKANQTLMDIARQEGSKEAAATRDVSEASRTDKKAHAMQAKLRGLSGEKFDQSYMREMVQDHEKAVALFQREAKNGKDERVRQAAQQILPTLEEHLKMAREVGSQVGVKG